MANLIQTLVSKVNSLTILVNSILSNSKKIEELTDSSLPLDSNSYFHVSQGGSSHKVAADDITGSAFTPDQEDAVTGSASPSSTNVFATIADVNDAGGGDMSKSAYDVTGTNDSVDNALRLGDQLPAFYASLSYVNTELSGKEDAFSKNTGFNLNTGTTAGTVAEGDHLHAGVYEPADADIQTHLSNTDIHLTADERLGLDNVNYTINASNAFATMSDISAAGGGDMLISVYGGTASGIVDDSDKLNGQLATFYATVTQLNTKENSFSKNTAFNLNLGTTAGTVSEGDHLHTGVYEPANANIQAHITDTDDHLSTLERAGMDAVNSPITGTNPVATMSDVASAGGGDMLKSVYDSLDDGSVNDSRLLGGELPGFYTALSVFTTHDTNTDIHLSAAERLSITNTPSAPTGTNPIATAADIDGFEDAFTKNTGFNKDLGTTAGTVAEGNHNHDGTYEQANANIQSHITDTNVHLSTTERQAINNANAPSGTNPIATINDVNTIGFGDMLKATYDTDNDGVVDDSDRLGGETPDFYAEATHLHTGVYEPTFGKNTGFNKPFGTVAGTVAEGDHTHTDLQGTSNQYATNTISFLNTTGDYYGTDTTPRTGAIAISDVGAVTGAISVVYYNNATLDLTGTIKWAFGDFMPNVTNKLYMERDSEGNIFMNVTNESDTKFVKSDTDQANFGTRFFNIVGCTQEQYDLGTKDADTYYFIPRV